MVSLKVWLHSAALSTLVGLLAGCAAATPTATPAAATDTPAAYPPPVELPSATPNPTSYPEPVLSPAPSPTADGYPAGLTPSPTAVRPVTITYQNYEIVPAQTTIKAGTRVVFLIEGGRHQPYNFSKPNTFEAPADLGEGTTYEYTFAESGTTTILCGYHSNMRATVIVQP